MKILAIDTGGDCCALALRVNGKHIAEKIIVTGRDQAKILAPLTQALLNENNLTVNDIDRFGIATGPGSFTGLRVGLSFVRGLALASGKKAVGIDHFTVTANAIKQPHPVLIIRESKRADLFCAWLNKDGLNPDGSLGDYFLSPAAALLETLPRDKSFSITGNGAAQLIGLDSNLSTQQIELSDSAFVQSLAQLVETSNSVDTKPQPLYMRGADVTAPKSIANMA
ncbi:MAG: tRNA (adenosine(37)-N6)-threonylcarbamoyltransferase complex dimerization subunit type 1 TsaB [Alphaproteobacteria bacterium]|nr:tRNA (adenosine(37)-N6)-threonylcarbamoyltransferase complex dimerization subunit type 1 TsaB [Alphaproteobacteria bacterium]